MQQYYQQGKYVYFYLDRLTLKGGAATVREAMEIFGQETNVTFTWVHSPQTWCEWKREIRGKRRGYYDAPISLDTPCEGWMAGYEVEGQRG